MTPKRYLVTSALPYINGIKHLGNLIGSLLPADVYARFLRQEGHDVLYICGTDEHGTPAEIAAHDAGVSIEAYCQDMYHVQKDIYERFNLHFDYFGRSSSLSNHHLTQEIFLDIYKAGFIEEREISQYYDEANGRFLPDRYVEGTCPHCGFEKARGDQCDGCGTLLDPTDLINPYGSLTGNRDIHLRQTRHLFLRMDKSMEELEQWLQTRETWPEGVKGIARKWLKEGLQPRCITRDLKWGIPVPLEGYEGKVFYVWFDAPNAYVAMTQDWAREKGDPEAWRTWWQPESLEEVSYTQFMAKDNVAFHAIFWPAMLMATQKPWKQVDTLKGLNWLTYEKGKFSTSQKRGIFTNVALDLFPADYWRYYLLAHCPESSDADFTFGHFAGIVNKDLADILGNFMNRSFSLIHKYFEGKVPNVLTVETLNPGLLNQAASLVDSFRSQMHGLKIRQAAATLRSLWVLGNTYITEEKPWEVIKSDPQKAGIILTHCVYLLRLYASVSAAFLPSTARKILSLLNDPENPTLLPLQEGLNFMAYAKGHKLAAPQRLFVKIDEETISRLTETYGGSSH